MHLNGHFDVVPAGEGWTRDPFGGDVVDGRIYGRGSCDMREMHHINFLASYTLGHAIDHVSGLNIGGEQRPVLPVTIGDEASIDQALAFEKGDALFDVRHRFVISFGAELPTPKQMGAIMTPSPPKTAPRRWKS